MKNAQQIKILGSRIDIFEDYESVYSQIKNYIENVKSPGYITVNNVHTIVEAAKDKKFREIINSSFLSIPDGRPLSVIQKIKCGKGTRIFGPSLFEQSIKWSQKSDIKHFFFGSDKKILNDLQRIILEKFPKTKIAGVLDPPFTEFTEEQNHDYLKIINDSGADIVWIALGAPKQEKWIYENYQKLNKGLMIGIGAGFNYLTGKIKHAPDWMKNSSLEWCYRLVQDPRRLWKRYLKANTLFIYFYFLKLLKLKKF